MKLTAGLLAALAGGAAAAQPAAQVYLVAAREAASTTPSVSPSLARLVLLQRLAPFGQGPSTHDIPKGTDVDAAVSALNRFGKPSPALFDDSASEAPRQLVVMLEDMTEQQIKDLGRDLSIAPAFEIADPPNADAHDDLVRLDLGRVAVVSDKCDVRQVTSPFGDCWGDRPAVVAKYNVKKDPDLVKQVSQRLARLTQLAQLGELETAIVLLPSVAAAGSWSDQPLELRRRQAERVMTSPDRPWRRPAATSAAENAMLQAKGPVPACFNSEDSCAKATGNCSQHGSCMNKYGGEGKEVCYACHCLSTRGASGSLTHWAGATCNKADISVSFWLFAGFTLALVSILWLAVSMLFRVGQEKLPGVIGAGVSRSK